MSDLAVKIDNMSKMYKLYRRPMDKVLDVFGINNMLFWRKHYFQEFWALREIDLEIKKGERIGFIGRNGAGKSTLLKIITGNISPTEGTVNVNGNIQALMELGTGFHPEFTGRENIRASLAYQGLSPAEIRKKEDEIIDFAELEEFIDQPIKTYSAGMYARLAFSTATSIEPEILIIDEVLGAGDAYFAGKCVDRMKQITSQTGATVFFVSHDLDSVLRLCDRAIWLDRGRVVAEGDTLQIIKMYTASVRKQDEMRLKLRNLRIKKKSIRGIEIDDPTRYQFICHLITEDMSHPKEKHPIFRVALYEKDKMLTEINVGDAMDNDISQTSYVSIEPGYINWGNPYKVNGRFARNFENTGGKYMHAVFILRVPEIEFHRENLRIEVEYLDNTREDIFFEIYFKDNYTRLGCLYGNNTGKIQKLSFDIPQAILEEKIEASEELAIKEADKDSDAEDDGSAKIDDVYGGGGVDMDKVSLLNKNDEDTHVYTSGEEMCIRIHYKVRQTVNHPTVIVAIYRMDGICVSQVISQKDGFTVPHLEGKGFIDVRYSPLLLGKGDYVISLGIFKPVNLLNPQEQTSYCVHDRKYQFKVVQPEDIKMELGVVNHPVKWSICHEL